MCAAGTKSFTSTYGQGSDTFFAGNLFVQEFGKENKMVSSFFPCYPCLNSPYLSLSLLAYAYCTFCHLSYCNSRSDRSF